MRHKYLLALMIALCAASLRAARADSWEPTPIIAHEWGVQVFTDDHRQVAADLPPFFLTAANPGKQVQLSSRVKDTEVDSGLRLKPLLYFYMPEADPLGRYNIGVEMRFAQGRAGTWYPQVNEYRTPEMIGDAQPPDLAAWKKKNPDRDAPNKLAVLPHVPDDPRMQLAWDNIQLAPASAKLSLNEDGISKDHWLAAARNVNSAYVSANGVSEKFLFYEGPTRETPAVALFPDQSAMRYRASDGNTQRATFLRLVNPSDQPVYDIFVVYRDKDRLYVRYAPQLDPMNAHPDPAPGNGRSYPSIAIPDFSTRDLVWFTPDAPRSVPGVRDQLFPNADLFADGIPWIPAGAAPHATTERLLESLTSGPDPAVIGWLRRDPADPQGPTLSSRLFPDEAVALEKIWHSDFFEQPGLSILYRESPAALDQEMPLNLYSNMYHYFQLSRCGLVLLTHIDPTAAPEVRQAAEDALNPKATNHAAAVTILRAHPLLAQGALTLYVGNSTGTDPAAALRQELAAPGAPASENPK